LKANERVFWLSVMFLVLGFAAFCWGVVVCTDNPSLLNLSFTVVAGIFFGYMIQAALKGRK
jgi:hypothetical protein